MKKFITILRLAVFIAIPFVLSNCTNDFDFDSVTAYTAQDSLSLKMVTTTTYEVPVVEGYTTVVSYDGMLLAKTSTPITITIPKQATQITKAATDGLSNAYLVGSIDYPFTNLWQTVLFEDSKNGDYDYNDIIVHVNYQTVGDMLTVNVQPIALGSTKTIKLGFKWKKGAKSGEKIVAENCRTEIFGGMTGFINTQKYDKHYAEFAKTINVKTNDVENPLDIYWFIEVGDDGRLYAANPNRYSSLDEDDYPYGFVLTNTKQHNLTNDENQSANLATISDEAKNAWQKLDKGFSVLSFVDDVKDWTMPEVPMMPSNATDYTKTEAWKVQKGDDFMIPEGSTTSMQLRGNNNNYYVYGTLDISQGAWADYGTTNNIFVMPGGHLNIGNYISLQYFSIYNYGTVQFPTNGTANFSAGTAFYSVGNIDAPSTTFHFESNTNIFIDGDITAKAFETIGSSQVCVRGSMVLSGALTNTNSSKLCVAGNVLVGSLELNSNALMYTSSLTVTETSNVANNRLYLTNGTELYVNGDVFAPIIEFNSNGKLLSQCNVTSTGKLEMSNGAILDAKSVDCSYLNMNGGGQINLLAYGVINVAGGTARFPNIGSYVYVNIIGSNDEKGALECETFDINTTAVNKSFDSNLCIAFSTYGTIDSWNQNYITWGEIEHDASKITIPATECCSGYNTTPVDVADKGASWFSYPKENINISECYNFESWLSGDFDFIPLSSDLIFDITDTIPNYGNNRPVFDIDD